MKNKKTHKYLLNIAFYIVGAFSVNYLVLTEILNQSLKSNVGIDQINLMWKISLYIVNFIILILIIKEFSAFFSSKNLKKSKS